MPEEVWKPGSFTKNFSWGDNAHGLAELHSVIRAGFDNELQDVPRKLFRERISSSGRPDFIPINFFLFNKIENGTDLICVDELVFQAITWDHNPAFDKLALFAFIFSFVGRWKGADPEQRRPAKWAQSYVIDRVASQFHWNENSINANDIQSYISNDRRYQAETSRKLATNLNYLLHAGKIGEFSNPSVSRWWIDCLFLALDRIMEDAQIDGRDLRLSNRERELEKEQFFAITGSSNSEKSLAVKHLVRLYDRLLGRQRFNSKLVLSETAQQSGKPPTIPNDDMPRGAVHRTNPRVFKSIPPVCADLARLAGFDVVSPVELEGFDLKHYVSNRTDAALALLRESGIRSNMTVEEFLQLTRDI